MKLAKALPLGLLSVLLVLPAAAQEAKPDIDPAAIAILKDMATKLGGAKTLAVTVKGEFDVPNAAGQPIFYMTKSDVEVKRPDKMKVELLGDGPGSEFVYDGKTMTVYLPKENVAASASAPDKLEDMLDVAFDQAGISFPYADYLIDDPSRTLTENLKSAFVIGQSDVVGDTKTNIVGLVNDDLQAQLWIGADDKLPRLVWITVAQNGEKPRRAVEFSDWKLDGDIADDAFKSSAKPDAAKIELARPGAAAATK